MTRSATNTNNNHNYYDYYKPTDSKHFGYWYSSF
jgi:hypothetical protein